MYNNCILRIYMLIYIITLCFNSKFYKCVSKKLEVILIFSSIVETEIAILFDVGTFTRD